VVPRFQTVVEVGHVVHSSMMGETEKNSIPRKNEDDFQNVSIDYCADVAAPIEKSCYYSSCEAADERMILDAGEEAVHPHDCLDGDPIENDLVVEEVVVQDVHDEGGDVANRNTLEVAAGSRSILVVVEVVGRSVLSETNNHILKPSCLHDHSSFISMQHATQIQSPNHIGCI